MVGIAGGESRLICPAWNAMGGSWGPARTISVAADLGQAIYQVSANGGERTAVRAQGPNGFDLRWPVFLPSGQAYIYSGAENRAGAARHPCGPAGRERRAALLRATRTRRSRRAASCSSARASCSRSRSTRPAWPSWACRRWSPGACRRISTTEPTTPIFRRRPGDTRVLAFLGTRQVDRELRIVDRRGVETRLVGPGEYRDLALSPRGARASRSSSWTRCSARATSGSWTCAAATGASHQPSE